MNFIFDPFQKYISEPAPMWVGVNYEYGESEESVRPIKLIVSPMATVMVPVIIDYGEKNQNQSRFVYHLKRKRSLRKLVD